MEYPILKWTVIILSPFTKEAVNDINNNRINLYDKIVHLTSLHFIFKILM